eukprot:scaffold15795_cov110-Isochrysis_galbana.AAC.10
MAGSSLPMINLRRGGGDGRARAACMVEAWVGAARGLVGAHGKGRVRNEWKARVEVRRTADVTVGGACGWRRA